MLHPTRRKNEDKNLGRKYLELRERGVAFGRKKPRGKRMERKAARMKHKAARVKPQLDELTFGTFHILTAAVFGVTGIDTLLRPCAAKGCVVTGLQEARRDGTSELVASGYRVFSSGDCSGDASRKGQTGLDLR